jgi:hypothetical protein
LKSGGPSLGRSPGAHKQRRPVNQDQIQIFGEIGSTQFLEQGLAPCSFFRDTLFEMLCSKCFAGIIRHGAADMTAPANLIQHSFELAAARCEDLTIETSPQSRSRKFEPISAFFLIGS